MSEDLLYVYAVTRAGPPLPEGLRDMGGRPVRVVAASALAAVVSPVPAAEFAEQPLRARLEDMRWLERTARGHQQVVGALVPERCVIPLRLGTICRDEPGVRRLLADGRQRFQEAIKRLEGREEWGVKAYADIEPTDGTSASPSSSPSPSAEGQSGQSGPLSGREYLQRRRQRSRLATESWLRAGESVRAVHQALSELAESTRLHRPQDARLSGQPGQNLLNGAYLVPRERSQEFVALAGSLSCGASGLRIALTGPWAPYSFTEAEAACSGEEAP